MPALLPRSPSNRLALSIHVGMFCLLVANLPSAARTRAIDTAQPVLPPPATSVLESAPAAAPSLPSIQTQTPIIDAAPVRTPAISPAPSSNAPMLPQDAAGKQIAQRLEQLQRRAEPSSGYGSTAQASQAAWHLGLIYLHGAGVRQDKVAAQQWFERAVKKNLEPWGWAGLAWCALDGCTGPPQPDAASSALSRLRSTYPAKADYLAWIQATQRNPLHLQSSNQTPSKADTADLKLLERAAAAGDASANIELGVRAFARQDTLKATRYFRRVASESAFAAHNLRVVQAQARQGSTQAVRPTDSTAQNALNMARIYHRGQGVPANFSEALRFYRLAEQRGSNEAHKMLELIFSRPMPDGSLNVAWMQQLAHADASAPTVQLGSGVYAPQMQRPPTPLFDLLPEYWQAQVQSISR